MIMKNKDIIKIRDKIIDATMRGASNDKFRKLIAESIKIINRTK